MSHGRRKAISCEKCGQRCNSDCIVSTAQAEAGFLRQSHLGTNDDEIGDDIPVYCGAACVPCRADCDQVECAACGVDFDFLSHRESACPSCRAPLGSMPKYVRMSTEDYRQVNGDAPLSELSDAIKVKYRGRQLASKKLYGVVMSTVDRRIDDLNCYDPDDAAKPRAGAAGAGASGPAPTAGRTTAGAWTASAAASAPPAAASKSTAATAAASKSNH
jgi:hypothetical protein